jgi:hypothetical protein
MDLPPDQRYKKKYVLPGGFIPGPNKPKDIDSFVFPGLQHLSAIQKEGLPIWDPLREDDPERESVYKMHPFLLFGTADGPGLCYLHGRNGHQGYYGCRHFCPIPGRRFGRKSDTYYPAIFRPDDPHLPPDSNHPDVNVEGLMDTSSPARLEEYERKLKTVVESHNMARYTENRRNTGISKPSIFSGLSKKHRLSMLGMWPTDLMHLTGLNITDLLLSLWRGTIDCGPGDDTSTWDWAVLTGDFWNQHGATVASFKRHLVSSVERPPRDPAKKINSGYKAKEWLTYVYGMLPALLYRVLPELYSIINGSIG